MDKLEEGRRVFDVEIKAMQKMRDALNETFVKVLDMITNCDGKVIITGMGKPGHIAGKIAATMASLGTPSFYLNPAEAMHGDLGMVSSNDIVIAISYSGESDEIVRILPNIKMIGATIIVITANEGSSLARAADVLQLLPQFEEACYLGLAPTSSTTVELAYGDALSVVASGIYGFTNSDFGKFHPAGSLGKKIVLKVKDIMAKDEETPVVQSGTTLLKAIEEMSKKGLGIITVAGKEGELLGILTDGDLRRTLEKRVDIYSVVVDEVMTKRPYTVKNEMLAVDALIMYRNNSINSSPVVDNNNKIVGALTWQLIVKAGIVA